MTIEIDTVTLPAYWACALVNDDTSGMTDAEVAEMNKTLAPLEADGWRVVDVVRDESGEGQEPRFTNCYNMYAPYSGCSGGDTLDYVMHRAYKIPA